MHVQFFFVLLRDHAPLFNTHPKVPEEEWQAEQNVEEKDLPGRQKKFHVTATGVSHFTYLIVNNATFCFFLLLFVAFFDMSV